MIGPLKSQTISPLFLRWSYLCINKFKDLGIFFLLFRTAIFGVECCTLEKMVCPLPYTVKGRWPGGPQPHRLATGPYRLILELIYPFLSTRYIRG